MTKHYCDACEQEISERSLGRRFSLDSGVVTYLFEICKTCEEKLRLDKRLSEIVARALREEANRGR